MTHRASGVWSAVHNFASSIADPIDQEWAKFLGGGRAGDLVMHCDRSCCLNEKEDDVDEPSPVKVP
jgi:hypothetical protein